MNHIITEEQLRMAVANADVDWDILANGVIIENATDVTNHLARLRVPQSLYIGADYNDFQPFFYMTGDADSDAGGDTQETLTLTLNDQTNPVLATWDFTSTQSAGYSFDKAVIVGGGLGITGGLTITMDDPFVYYDPSTAAESEWWTGTNHDAVGDDNDNWELRQNATPGTNVEFYVQPDE